MLISRSLSPRDWLSYRPFRPQTLQSSTISTHQRGQSHFARLNRSTGGQGSARGRSKRLEGRGSCRAQLELSRPSIAIKANNFHRVWRSLANRGCGLLPTATFAREWKPAFGAIEFWIWSPQSRALRIKRLALSGPYYLPAFGPTQHKRILSRIRGPKPVRLGDSWRGDADDNAQYNGRKWPQLENIHTIASQRKGSCDYSRDAGSEVSAFAAAVSVAVSVPAC